MKNNKVKISIEMGEAKVKETNPSNLTNEDNNGK